MGLVLCLLEGMLHWLKYNSVGNVEVKNQMLFKYKESGQVKILKKTMTVQLTFNESPWYWLADEKTSDAL